MVETPDKIGRESILKVHVSKKELSLGNDVDLSDIARITTGFTWADLANLVNEAALLAGRLNKAIVERIDFIQAVERSIAELLLFMVWSEQAEDSGSSDDDDGLPPLETNTKRRRPYKLHSGSASNSDGGDTDTNEES